MFTIVLKFVIDRAVMNGKVDAKAMPVILSSGKEWDWSSKGSFVGLSGRSGALEISNRVALHLKDSTKMSTEQLLEKIMAED